jgi:hypothetical protein
LAREQHLSYKRIQAALMNLCGVEISQGGIDQIRQRAGQQANEGELHADDGKIVK